MSVFNLPQKRAIRGFNPAHQVSAKHLAESLDLGRKRFPQSLARFLMHIGPFVFDKVSLIDPSQDASAHWRRNRPAPGLP